MHNILSFISSSAAFVGTMPLDLTNVFTHISIR